MVKIRDIETESRSEEISNNLPFHDTCDKHSKHKKACCITNIDLEDRMTYTQVELYKTFRPLIFSMRLFGLLHIRQSNEKTKNKTRKTSLFSEIYSHCVIVILGLNFFRMLTMFNSEDGFKSSTFTKLIITSWTLLCFCNAAAYFRACRVFHCLPEFFLEWHKIQGNACHINLQDVRKTVIISTVFGWIFFTFSVCSSIYATLTTPAFDVFFTPVMYFSTEENLFLATRLPFHIILIYLSSSWSFPSAFSFILCRVLSKEFTYSNLCISKHIAEGGVFDGDMEICRRRHQLTCRLVSHADYVLSWFNASSYILNVLIACLLLYNIISDQDMMKDMVILSTHIFWLVVSLMMLATVSISGAQVNKNVSFYK